MSGPIGQHKKLWLISVATGLSLLFLFAQSCSNNHLLRSRGGLARRGSYPCCGPNSTPRVLWNTKLPGTVVTPFLVYEDNLILDVTGDQSGYWVQLNINSGKIGWSRPGGGRGLAECGGYLFAGSKSGDVRKLNIPTGEVLGRYRVSKDASSVLFGTSKAVYFSSGHVVGRFVPSTQKVTWKTRLKQDILPFYPVTVSGDVLMVTIVDVLYQSTQVVGVSMRSGRVLWTKSQGNTFPSDLGLAAYQNGALLNVAGQGLVRINALTGRTIGVINRGKVWNLFVVQGNVVFYAPYASLGQLVAQNLQNGRTLWKTSVPVSGHILANMRLAVSGHILYCQSPNYLYYAFDTRDGRLLWKYNYRVDPDGELLPVDGKLIVIGDHVVCLGT